MFTVRSHAKLVLRSTVAGLLCFCLGCSLPVIPADDTYEVLGGIVQREHPSLGRANSAFDLNKAELSAETESAIATPVVPSLFKNPRPLERLKHSPIIP
ncbi:MAG TPA: hypothetical protein EYN93_11665 [Planctomycetaceae bacterium]|nr:hypothetical protein [Planctomycetaceae bacterium]